VAAVTALLGLLLSGLGPVGTAAALAGTVGAAWWKLGKAAALAIALLACLAASYVVGSHQASVAAAAIALQGDLDRANAAFAAERAQAAAASRIAAADKARAEAAEAERQVSATRLQELEHALSSRPDGACVEGDAARRLREL
jgi:hypothetical protein